MKKLLQLLALLPTLVLGQTAIQKVGGGNNTISNGNVVVGNSTSITATGTGVIAATSIPTLSISTTAPLTGGGALTGNLTLAIPVATGSVNGYLSSTDWTTFNSKQVAGNYVTGLTGDVAATGPGNATATLATVNSNVGTFAAATVNGKGLVTAAANLSGDIATSGSTATLASVATAGTTGSSTAIPIITIDAKGRTLSIATAAVVAPAGTLTGTTLASNVVTSSLTSVGTIGNGTWQGNVVSGQYGGTGVANTGKTITLGGNVTTTGAFNLNATLTGNTAVTFPTSGTLATLAGVEALSNKTYNGNTWTAGTGTLTIAAGKTLTVSNTLAFTGTDSSSINFGAGGTVLYSGGSYVSSITGTSGQITASASTGAVTLSLPTALTSIDSITAEAATNLVLNGGSSGASLTLSQGTNGGLALLGKGTGFIDVTSSAVRQFRVNALGSNDATISFTTATKSQSDAIVFGDSTGNLLLQSAVGSSIVLKPGTTTGSVSIPTTTAASSSTTGALQVAGGGSVQGAWWAGDVITSIKSNAGGVGGGLFVKNSGSNTLSNEAKISFGTDSSMTFGGTEAARLRAVTQNTGNGAVTFAIETFNGSNTAAAISIDAARAVTLSSSLTITGGIVAPLSVILSNSAARGGSVYVSNPASSAVGNEAQVAFGTDAGMSLAGNAAARLRAINASAGNGAATFQIDTWNGSTSASALSFSVARDATFSGNLTVSGSGGVTGLGGTTPMHTSSTTYTSGAGASLGTLSNAPSAGNPTSWIKIVDNGTTRYIPAW